MAAVGFPGNGYSVRPFSVTPSIHFTVSAAQLKFKPALCCSCYTHLYIENTADNLVHTDPPTRDYNLPVSLTFLTQTHSTGVYFSFQLFIGALKVCCTLVMQHHSVAAGMPQSWGKCHEVIRLGYKNTVSSHRTQCILVLWHKIHHLCVQFTSSYS